MVSRSASGADTDGEESKRGPDKEAASHEVCSDLERRSKRFDRRSAGK